MKYEAPEVSLLAAAIEAIQDLKAEPGQDGFDDCPVYQDWE